MDTPKTQSDDNTERMLEEMRGKASKLIEKEDELVKKAKLEQLDKELFDIEKLGIYYNYFSDTLSNSPTLSVADRKMLEIKY